MPEPAQTEVVGSELTIVSPHWEGLRWEISRAFSEWHEKKYGTPVHVRYLDIGGGSSIVRYLTNNKQMVAGIDIIFGGGTDPCIGLKKEGMLQHVDLPAETAEAIPADLFGMPLRDKEGFWFGTYVSSFGILSNEKVRNWMHLPEANTWEDLTNPVLQSWVSSGDPRQSGSIHQMYEIIVQKYGWEKGWAVILAMSGNVRSFLKSASSSIKEATFGEVAFALGIDQYGLSQVTYLGPESSRFVLPKEATVFSADAIGILKQAAQPVLARRFVEFVLSREGQLLVALPKGAPGGAVRYDINRMGVRPALYTEVGAVSPIKVNPFAQYLGFDFKSDKAAERRGVLAGLLGAYIIDLHSELKAAWIAVNALPPERAELKAQLSAELLRPPISEEDAQALARKIPPAKPKPGEKPKSAWDSPIRRNELILDWQRSASVRYADVLAKARAAK